MDDILNMLAKAVLEYGAIGILALAGWCLAGWFLYRDIKKKETINEDIKKKDQEILDAKDQVVDVVKDLSEKRLDDAKELIDDYNNLATSTIQTLDRLTMALDVRNQIRRGNDGSNI